MHKERLSGKRGFRARCKAEARLLRLETGGECDLERFSFGPTRSGTGLGSLDSHVPIPRTACKTTDGQGLAADRENAHLERAEIARSGSQ